MKCMRCKIWLIISIPIFNIKGINMINLRLSNIPNAMLSMMKQFDSPYKIMKEGVDQLGVKKVRLVIMKDVIRPILLASLGCIFFKIFCGSDISMQERSIISNINTCAVHFFLVSSLYYKITENKLILSNLLLFFCLSYSVGEFTRTSAELSASNFIKWETRAVGFLALCVINIRLALVEEIDNRIHQAERSNIQNVRGFVLRPFVFVPPIA